MPGVLGELTLPTRRVTGPKVRTIVAMLLIRAPEPVSVDELAAELWEHDEPQSARTTLRTHVYHLRQRLTGWHADDGGPVLRTEPSGYRLVVPAEGLDTVQFIRSVREGRRLLESGKPSASSCTLADGLALWRGAALADVLCGPVLRRWATYLEELRREASILRISAEFELGRYCETVPELGSLVASHPLNEWFAARYAEALHHSGRRGEALDALAHLRKLMRSELGLEPSSKIEELQRRLLLGSLPVEPPPAHGHGYRSVDGTTVSTSAGS